MLRPIISVALATIFLTACRFSAQVETSPIRGEVPDTIAIWPLVSGGMPPDADLWFSGLAYHIGRRGYRVIAPGVAREVLLGSDITPSGADDWGAVGRALNADAVLLLEVSSFEARPAGALQQASWDLAWRLVSTRGQGQQWTHRAHGRWRQADRDPLDATRRFDAMSSPPPLVPIGGHRLPGFRDARDLFAYLHRAAMERLPARVTP